MFRSKERYIKCRGCRFSSKTFNRKVCEKCGTEYPDMDELEYNAYKESRSADNHRSLDTSICKSNGQRERFLEQERLRREREEYEEDKKRKECEAFLEWDRKRQERIRQEGQERQERERKQRDKLLETERRNKEVLEFIEKNGIHHIERERVSFTDNMDDDVLCITDNGKIICSISGCYGVSEGQATYSMLSELFRRNTILERKIESFESKFDKFMEMVELAPGGEQYGQAEERFEKNLNKLNE